jgi:serine/threonine protein kinase
MLFENNTLKLSPDAIDNLIQHEDKYYKIDFLKEEGKYVQGGNGVVFRLLDEQEELEYVIKVMKFPDQWKDDWKIKKRINRFEREIEALYVARENILQNVVGIEFHGIIKINDLDFQYYVMQKCDCNLNEYLRAADKELNLFQKTLLCQKILLGIMGLNDYKIYHRDIKHDNIFFIGNEPLIGDLGLADKKDSDIRINERGELIGPTGWFSPEAINKYLVEKTPNPNNFDCDIDSKSEVFQLGKLFWFIYQGNIPIGQVEYLDFIPQDNTIFNLLFNMLKYSKGNRYDSQIVLSQLNQYMEQH